MAKFQTFPLKDGRQVVVYNHKEGAETEIVAVDKMHNVLIIDRSGSMSGSIDNLIDCVIEAVKSMSPTDLCSIIWFSGENQNGYVVKAKRLNADDKIDIETMLNKYRSVVGATCFSDSLSMLDTLISETSDLCPNFNCLLFTDGQPVVNWSYEEELNRCSHSILKNQKSIISLNTIGFGFYYNEEFLKTVASLTSYGKHYHSSKIEDYTTIFNNTYEIAKEGSNESVIISTAGAGDEILYLSENFSRRSVNAMETKLNRRKNQFFIIQKTPSTIYINGVFLVDAKISKAVPATVTNFLYAYAYELMYSGDSLKALDILAKELKDKKFATLIQNAFTVAERNEFLTLLSKACIGRKVNSYRKLDGECDDNFIPAENAFCLIDLIKLLDDADSYYVPLSSGEYKRIGKKSVDEFNLFTADKKALIYAPFSSVVYNENKANLSVRYTIPGSVSINPKEAKELLNSGILNPDNKTVNSFMYRNQTIIKDGNRNTDYINAYVTAKTYDELLQLQSAGITIELLYPDTLFLIEDIDHVLVKIDITQLPVINRLYSKNADEISDILHSIKQLNDVEVQRSVLKHFIKLFAEEKAINKKKNLFETLTVRQIEILQNHGLASDLCYQGVAKTIQESTDSYESRSIKFYLVGLASIPSIKATIDKNDEINFAKQTGAKCTKKLNDNEQLIIKIIESLENDGKTLNSVKNFDWLVAEAKSCDITIKTIRNSLSVAKICKIVTNSFWTDLNQDSKGFFTYAEAGLTLKITPKKETVFI